MTAARKLSANLEMPVVEQVYAEEAAAEKAAIMRLAGKKLISKFLEVFSDKADDDLNFRILPEVICRNQTQALELSLQMADEAIKNVTEMSAMDKAALRMLVPRKLLLDKNWRSNGSLQCLYLTEANPETLKQAHWLEHMSSN